MRTLDAIVQRLTDSGIDGADIFAGSDVNLPSGPGPFITIIESAGRAPLAAHNTTALRQPALQITARGDLMPEAADMVEAAYDALGGKESIANTLIGDVFFLVLRPSSEPFQLTSDAQGRVRLAFNVNALRR